VEGMQSAKLARPLAGGKLASYISPQLSSRERGERELGVGCSEGPLHTTKVSMRLKEE
jgi:hypothetical protein